MTTPTLKQLVEKAWASTERARSDTDASMDQHLITYQMDGSGSTPLPPPMRICDGSIPVMKPIGWASSQMWRAPTVEDVMDRACEDVECLRDFDMTGFVIAGGAVNHWVTGDPTSRIHDMDLFLVGVKEAEAVRRINALAQHLDTFLERRLSSCSCVHCTYWHEVRHAKCLEKNCVHESPNESSNDPQADGGNTRLRRPHKKRPEYKPSTEICTECQQVHQCADPAKAHTDARLHELCDQTWSRTDRQVGRLVQYRTKHCITFVLHYVLHRTVETTQPTASSEAANSADSRTKSHIGGDVAMIPTGREETFTAMHQCGSTLSNRCILQIPTAYKRVEIQVVLRHYDSIGQVLFGFDLGASAMAFDGRKLYLTPMGHLAMTHGINVLDVGRRRASYEDRIASYMKRGFALVLPKLCREAITLAYCTHVLLPHLHFRLVVHALPMQIERREESLTIAAATVEAPEHERPEIPNTVVHPRVFVRDEENGGWRENQVPVRTLARSIGGGETKNKEPFISPLASKQPPETSTDATNAFDYNMARAEVHTLHLPSLESKKVAESRHDKKKQSGVGTGDRRCRWCVRHTCHARHPRYVPREFLYLEDLDERDEPSIALSRNADYNGASTKRPRGFPYHDMTALALTNLYASVNSLSQAFCAYGRYPVATIHFETGKCGDKASNNVFQVQPTLRFLYKAIDFRLRTKKSHVHWMESLRYVLANDREALQFIMMLLVDKKSLSQQDTQTVENMLSRKYADKLCFDSSFRTVEDGTCLQSDKTKNELAYEKSGQEKQTMTDLPSERELAETEWYGPLMYPPPAVEEKVDTAKEGPVHSSICSVI